MTMAKKETVRFKYSPHAAWRLVEQETIILDLNTSVYYSLNLTASFVWKKLGEGLSVPEISEALAEEYGVKPETAAADVDEIVKELQKSTMLLPA
jgi:hypothetical protein